MNKPIAGVDLEAEQVIEEENEQPVKVGGRKLRRSYLIFGGIMIVEAAVLLVVFGEIGGGAPHEADAQGIEPADARVISDEVLDELVDYKTIEVGDVSIYEDSVEQPGRRIETTIVGLKVAFSKEASEKLTKLTEKNPDAEEMIIWHLQHHIRRFMAMHGGENLAHRQDTLGEDLRRYFWELSGDDIGGLSHHITRVGFSRTKMITR